MRWVQGYTAACLMLLGMRAHAQVNRVEHGAFVDEGLHFSYPLPPGLVPYDIGAVAKALGQGQANRNETLLFAARAKSGPFGVVLLAERMGTDRKPPLTRPDDFLNALTHTFAYGPSVRRSHMRTTSGLELARMDWESDGEFASGVVFQAGQQLVCLKFTAPTADALARMTSTVGSIGRVP